MSESTANLPDPTKGQATPDAKSADDMLAEMATGEIDRLLAEANVEKTAALPPGAAGNQIPLPADPEPAADGRRGAASLVPPEVSQDPQTSAQLDALFDELNSPTDSAPGATPADAAPKEVAVEAPQPAATAGQSELNAVLSEITAQDAEKVDAPAASGTVAEKQAEPERPPSPLNPEEQTGDLEKQVLAAGLEEVREVEAEAARQAANPVDEPEPAEPRAPLFIKLLELVNLPIVFLSDAARELLGKVALVTLVNALMLLAYVLIFRKG